MKRDLKPKRTSIAEQRAKFVQLIEPAQLARVTGGGGHPINPNLVYCW
jgi:hypothetical protein